MDTFTTAVGGALLAKALPRENRGPSAVWCVTLSSALPDIDIVADWFSSDPFAGLLHHRAFTHSLVGLAVMAPLVALLFRRFGPDKNFRRLLALATLGLTWHIFTDLATSWGTMVFYPFNRDRVVWDLLFIIDFIFSAILLVPQLQAWIYRKPRAALRRGILVWAALASFTALMMVWAGGFLGRPFDYNLFALLASLEAATLLFPRAGGWGFRQDSTTFARIGVTALAGYLTLVTVAHFRALGLVERRVEERGIAHHSLAALPQPLSPFLWSGLVLSGDGVYQTWVNVFKRQAPDFDFIPSQDGEYIARARDLPEVKTYLWFARFPVARYRRAEDRHIVEFGDLRFRGRHDADAGFTFRVVFDAQGEVLSAGFAGR
jgi:membrane-bound metal-dependent hydrolase YbcI (DUF457 family)